MVPTVALSFTSKSPTLNQLANLNRHALASDQLVINHLLGCLGDLNIQVNVQIIFVESHRAIAINAILSELRWTGGLIVFKNTLDQCAQVRIVTGRERKWAISMSEEKSPERKAPTMSQRFPHRQCNNELAIWSCWQFERCPHQLWSHLEFFR